MIWTKTLYRLAVIDLVLAALALGGGIAVYANKLPRFERLNYQTISIDEYKNYNILAFHDREAGQEIVCVSLDSQHPSISCYPTGRKWTSEK